MTLIRPAGPRGNACDSRGQAWPLERVLFALAGTMTLLSAALAVLVSGWFLLLTALVGINQWLYVWLGACPASLILGRVLGLRSVIYPSPASLQTAISHPGEQRIR